MYNSKSTWDGFQAKKYVLQTKATPLVLLCFNIKQHLRVALKAVFLCKSKLLLHVFEISIKLKYSKLHSLKIIIHGLFAF